MIYEYCEEIKNTKINRDALPAHCSSYLEMGLYVSLDTIKEVNKIFREAGVIELKAYKSNKTINEADEEAVKKSVKDRLVNAFKTAWSKIVGIWEKIRDFIEGKMKEFRTKIGDKFMKIDIDAYKDKLDKAFEKSEFVIVDPAKIEEKIKNATDVSLSDIKAIENVEGVSEYKKNLDDYFKKTYSVKIDASTLKEKKKLLYDIVTSSTKGSISRDYHKAKVAADKAMRELKKFDKKPDEEAKTSRDALKLALTTQNYILGAQELKKKNFTNAMHIITKTCMVCLGKAPDAKKAEEEPKNESVKYDVDFVNEVFNW